METKFHKSVLVPTDFSEACDNALNHAIELSKYLNTKVYVLHVIDSQSKTLFNNDEFFDGTNIISAVENKLKEYLAEKNYAHLEGVAREGDIFSTISDVANDLEAGMILLGTHGKVGFQKLMGSYALKVINSSKIPVVVVQKKGFTSGYKNIVFPISLHSEDRQKAEYAVHIAKIFNSTIHLLPKAETSINNRNKLESIVRQIRGFLNKYDVENIEVVASNYGSDFDKQVLNYSTAIGADMIMIISDPSERLPLFGAQEETILFNGAQIPVMCVNDKNLRASELRSVMY